MALFTLVVKIAASLTSIYMSLSPIPSMYRIHKAKDTGVTSVIPLLALWDSGFMWMLYGVVTKDVFPQIVTSLVGFLLALSYISVYFLHSTKKKSILQFLCLEITYFTVVAAFALFGDRFVSHDVVKLVVGWIAILASILLYGSPLTAIKRVVETKDVRLIPIAMVLVGLANNTLWTTYGFLISDILIIIPSAFSLMLGSIQAILYAVYRKRSNAKVGQPDTFEKPQSVHRDIEMSGATDSSNSSNGSSTDVLADVVLETDDIKTDRSEADLEAAKGDEEQQPVRVICTAEA